MLKMRTFTRPPPGFSAPRNPSSLTPLFFALCVPVCRGVPNLPKLPKLPIINHLECPSSAQTGAQTGERRRSARKRCARNPGFRQPVTLCTPMCRDHSRIMRPQSPRYRVTCVCVSARDVFPGCSGACAPANPRTPTPPRDGLRNPNGVVLMVTPRKWKSGSHLLTDPRPPRKIENEI